MRLGKVAVCLALALFAAATLASAQSARARSVAGQILVTFAPGANADARAAAHRGANGRVLTEVPGRGVALVAVSPGDEQAAIARYRRNPNVVYAEPNYIRSIPEPAAHDGGAVVPRDKYFGQQWGFHNTGQEFYCIAWVFGDLCFFNGTPGADIDAPEAWAVSTGLADGDRRGHRHRHRLQPSRSRRRTSPAATTSCTRRSTRWTITGTARMWRARLRPASRT